MNFIIDSHAEIMRIFPDGLTMVHINSTASRKYYLPFKDSNIINIDKSYTWPRAEMYLEILDNVTTLNKQEWLFPSKNNSKYVIKYEEYHKSIPPEDISNCNEENICILLITIKSENTVTKYDYAYQEFSVSTSSYMLTNGVSHKSAI